MNNSNGVCEAGKFDKSRATYAPAVRVWGILLELQQTICCGDKMSGIYKAFLHRQKFRG